VIRERIFAWSDPKLTADAASGMAGLDFLRAMRDGVVPAAPIAALVGLSIAEVDPGRVMMRLTPAEYHLQPDRLGAWRDPGDTAGFGDGLRGALDAAERAGVHVAGDQGELRAGCYW
jgi:hypothetical protein